MPCQLLIIPPSRHVLAEAHIPSRLHPSLQLFKEQCRGYNTGVDIGELLRSILKLVRIYHVRIDVNYATLLINMLCLEGMAGALDPSYNVLDRAKPLLKPHENRLIRPVFRSIFPLLLRAKRLHDWVLFGLLKRLKKIEAPPDGMSFDQQQQ